MKMMNNVVEENYSESFESENGDKEEERYEVGEDVYALIYVAPFTSSAFSFAVFVILIKYALFLFLTVDLYNNTGDGATFFSSKSLLIRCAQFFLLPIAIATQEDLIYVYSRVANIRYEPDHRLPAATRWKFWLSFSLRLVDGLFSLIINFVLIMTEDNVRGIFLNFAALHFLQTIDDVGFQMAQEGFFGDGMEDRCAEVQKTTMSRRVGDAFTNALDSFLYLVTYLCMIAVYGYVVWFEDARTEL